MHKRAEALSESASFRRPRERLSVFISSTIQECAAERVVAKKAVISLNHDAFVFEDVGARPWPPPEVYLPGLYAADIFVAVYKHSYGWIGPDQQISGLEDEFRHALKRGMPTLVYVYSNPNGRDERLSRLIKEIQVEGFLTYAQYREESELYSRIRDDIEAVVATRFIRGVEVEAALSAAGASSQKISGAVIRRLQSEERVLSALEQTGEVQVTGESGSGKTTLLASVAEQQGFLFLSASQLSPLDLINAITSSLKALRKEVPAYGATLFQAGELLRCMWQQVDAATLVLDDVADVPTIRQILSILGSLGGTKRVLYSLRTGANCGSSRQVVVPPFEPEEAWALFTLLKSPISREEVNRVVQLTGGNALLLHYCAAYPGSPPETSLSAFETFKWNELPPQAQEVVAYVALSETRLTLQEVVSLVESANSAIVGAAIANGGWFLAEDRFGYGMRHHHQRETVLSLLAATPQRMSFYARRVAGIMREKRDMVSAFMVLTRANDPLSADYGRPALFEVGRRGDWRQVLEIGSAMLARAREERDVSDTVQLLVQIAEAAQHVGEVLRSDDLLREAAELAGASGFDYLVQFVEDARICKNASLFLTAESLDALTQLRDKYQTRGQLWPAAKVSIDLSVLLLRLDRSEEAAAAARSALDVFEQVGDDYGIDLALRNLATALSLNPASHEEFSETMRKIDCRSGTRDTSQRERAWLCNILVRRFRVAKQFERAKEYADEAIKIATALGDTALIAINTMNLGNVCRDQGELDEALHQYAIGSALANQVQKRETEAKCARLASAVCLQKHQTELAIQHALFGCSLVRETFATGEILACYEQLGDSQFAAGRNKDGYTSYLEGASYGLRGVEADEAWELAEQGLRWLATRRHTSEYISWIDRLVGCHYSSSDVGDWQEAEALVRRFVDIVKAVNRPHSVALTVLHVHLMIDGVPAPIAHFLFVKAAHALCDEVDCAPGEVWRRLFPLLALLASVPPATIAIQDVVAVSERFSEKTSSFYFKVRADGLPTWVFTIELARPVVCSVTAIDNDSESALVSLALVLFLKGFEAEIGSQLLGGPAAVRQEVQIYVMNAQAMPDSIREVVEPNLTDQPCTVSRPTDARHPEPVPTVVYFTPGISNVSHWAGEEVSGLEILFGYTLMEVVYQILRGEVDLDVLAPKIVRLVRQNVCLTFNEAI